MLKIWVVVTCLMNPNLVLALDLKTLALKYQNIATLKADVQQVKTAPYLIKPLVSKINFLYSGDKILWNIYEPNKTNLTIERSGITINGQKAEKDEQVTGKITALTNLIFDLMNGRLALQDKDKQITISKNRLMISPAKIGAELPFDMLTVELDGEELIKSIEIKASTESTNLTFRNIRVEYKVKSK